MFLPGSPGIETKWVGQRAAVFGTVTYVPKIPPFRRGGRSAVRMTLGWVIDRYFTRIARLYSTHPNAYMGM